MIKPFLILLFLYSIIYLHSRERDGEREFHQLCCLCLKLLSQPYSVFFFWHPVVGNVSVLD